MASRPLPSFYGPARGFAALPPALAEYEPARAVILHVPYDATTSFRSGTRDGPRAIVDASMQLELYDMELGREIAGAGIHTLPELEPHLGDPAAMVARVAEATALLLADGKLPIMLGGEHTLTVGGVRAARALHPNLALLYLDAHADVRGSYLDAPYNHASALRLSLEGMALPVPSGAPQPAVAVGIRSMAVEEAAYLAETGLPMVTAAQVAATRRAGADALTRLWQETLAWLGEPGRPLYVSIDLDAFDPAAIAAVGTPEPGGLDWYEVTSLLRAAARRHPIVMADVVELAPGEGPLASAFTAAKLAYKLIGYALFRDQLR